MKPIGIMGGTFDPIHLGHLITAQAVVEIRGLEKIIFIPSNISPHKQEIKYSPAKHRLNMVKLAIKDFPYFAFSDMDIRRGGISYMVDTLDELKKSFKKLELIVGYDNIEKFYTWKEPDRLLELARLVVMTREIEREIHAKDKYYNSAIFVKTPSIDIKATEIRKRIKKNLSIDFLVTKEVKNYILKNNLYKD
jgi:nicotinate-nucleotide adenylyltransferase